MKKADADDSKADEAEVMWDDKIRTWELSLSLRAFDYVGKVDKLSCFFAVTVCPESDRVRRRDRVRLITEYTQAWPVKKGRTTDETLHSFDPPIRLYERKSFKMSYKNLKKHLLKVDMWRFNLFTYNSFFGSGKRSLSQVAWKEAFMSLPIKQNFTLADKAKQLKRGKKGALPEVAIFHTTCLFEEVFNFSFHAENWTFELSDSFGSAKRLETLKHEQKMLTFFMPKDYRSNASTRTACSVQRTDPAGSETIGKTTRFFWSGPRERSSDKVVGKRAVKFRGTQSALQGSHFTVALQSVDKRLEKLPGKMEGKLPSKVIGQALFGLMSVLDMSVFKGKLKALVTDEQDDSDFTVGSLFGSARTVERSIGVPENEDIPGGRPRQPSSERTVSHLNKKEFQLVVRVSKAEGLAIGDTNTGSSDPYVRILWDNMMKQSAVQKATLRPVFNQSFYFPVRFFDTKVLSNARYRRKALPLELQSKGPITIELWDDENTSADFLGGTKVELKDMLVDKPFEKRSLLGGVKPMTDDGEHNEKELAKMDSKKLWYERQQMVRVYDGFRTEAIGCSLPKVGPTFIYFEAYFYPDKWPDDINFEGGWDDGESDSDFWQSKKKYFEDRNAKFAATYALAFPDSIGGMACRNEDKSSKKAQLRTFPCVAQHSTTRDVVPLMAFLARITTDQKYSQPTYLLHWMNCISFSSMKSQDNTGMIQHAGWKDPQNMLSARKGPVQDHALLLCSILLGSGHDAYVCKGTIRDKDKGGRLVDHCWVMTRDKRTGWVTFWEPCTRETFHLPKRVTIASSAQGSKGEPDEEKEEEEEDDDEQDSHDGQLAEQAPTGAEFGEVATYEVRDSRLTAEDINLLPTIGRTPRPKAKAKQRGDKANGRDAERNRLKEQRLNLVQAPNPKLMDRKTTLVDWLPYDSIEVVFNRVNLWANHQNHHPAVIMYDLEDQGELPPWLPFLSEHDKAERKIPHICGDDVVMEPELKARKLTAYEQILESELKESIKLYRSKMGKDTNWDPDQGDLIRKHIDSFLEIHDDIRKLDRDFCGRSDCAQKKAEVLRKDADFLRRILQVPEGQPVPEVTENKLPQRELLQKFREVAAADKADGKKKKKKSPIESPYEWVMTQLECQVSTNNKYGSSFSESKKVGDYENEQKKRWDDVFSKVSDFKKGFFPTKKGKSFRGFTRHFTTSDPLEVQQMLMQDQEYTQEILRGSRPNKEDDGIVFSVYSKIFGLLGGVQSTWLYFGLQEPLKDEDDVKPSKGAEAQAQEQPS